MWSRDRDLFESGGYKLQNKHKKRLKKVENKSLLSAKKLVGVARLKRAAPASQMRDAAVNCRYAPLFDF